MSQPIQKSEMENFKGTLSQAIASCSVARASYAAMMLTPEQVRNPNTSDDKGYQDLIEASSLLETAMIQCTAAIFERAKEDQREQAAKPVVMGINGGKLSN